MHVARRDAPTRHAGELRAAGHPVLIVTRERRRATSAGFFVLREFATAVAGWVLEINPFDQPNVQEAKDNTKRVLEEGAPRARGRATSTRCSSGLAPPRYLAIMGYLPYSDDVEAAIARLRERADRAQHGVATTFGYGPRFLHSTGQFHKGGPTTGALPAARHDARATTSRSPGEPYALRHADLARRPTATCRPCATTASTARAHHASGDIDAIRERSDADSASSASARWAATWSIASSATRTTTSSRSTSTRTPSRRPRARRDRRRLARGPRRPSSRRRAMVWIMVPAGDPTEQTVDELAELLERGRHDRRRRQHQLARRRARARPSSTSRASTTSTSAPPAASGASRSATA